MAIFKNFCERGYRLFKKFLDDFFRVINGHWPFGRRVSECYNPLQGKVLTFHQWMFFYFGCFSFLFFWIVELLLIVETQAMDRQFSHLAMEYGPVNFFIQCGKKRLLKKAPTSECGDAFKKDAIMSLCPVKG